MKRIVCIITAVVMAVAMCGCRREAEIVSYNVSKQADYFNVTRRLTVINSRSDKVVLQMVGRFSIEDQPDGIAVLVELDKAKSIYQKHYVYMNEWTMYTVEDITGVYVSPYAYEFEFMPQYVDAVKIRTDEITEDMGIINDQSEE